MRIGFDAKRAFFNKSGLGSYSRNLIQGLAEKYPENEYVLYTPGLNYELFEPTQQCIQVRAQNVYFTVSSGLTGVPFTCHISCHKTG